MRLASKLPSSVLVDDILRSPMWRIVVIGCVHVCVLGVGEVGTTMRNPCIESVSGVDALRGQAIMNRKQANNNWV